VKEKKGLISFAIVISGLKTTNNDGKLGGDSQNFLRKFVRFFVTLGLKS